jgi:uncharacterized membrane protein YczE
LRGGAATRGAYLLAGLAVFAAGIVCLYQARLGLSPWDVLNQGISRHTPLSFGTANIAVGCTILGVAFLLGATIGIGTVANAVLVGAFVDLLLRLHPVRELAEADLGVRVALLVLGILLIGVATALYVGAGFGAGPRDSLMLALTRWSGARIGIVRGLLEAAATVAGFVLGGTVGIGTLIFVIAIGPVVEASFVVLARSPFAAARAGTEAPGLAAIDPH